MKRRIKALSGQEVFNLCTPFIICGDWNSLSQKAKDRWNKNAIEFNKNIAKESKDE